MEDISWPITNENPKFIPNKRICQIVVTVDKRKRTFSERRKTPSAFINCSLSAKINKNIATSSNVTSIVCSSLCANIGIYFAREPAQSIYRSAGIAACIINKQNVDFRCANWTKLSERFDNCTTRYIPIYCNTCSGRTTVLFNFVRQPRHVNRI